MYLAAALLLLGTIPTNPCDLAFVDDPYAAVGMSCPAADSLEARRYRIVADLDGDGRNDLLLSEPERSFGNAGGAFRLYLARPGGYARCSEVFLHPAAVHSGPHGILSIYRRSSGNSGTIVRYRITSDAILMIDSTEI